MRNREIAAHGGCNLFLRPKSKERATNTAFRWGYGVDSKHSGCWPQLHGKSHPGPHADGCAAQCFEGVQRGSLIILSAYPRPQVATPVLRPGLSLTCLVGVPSCGLATGSWRTADRLDTDEMYPSALCCAQRLSLSRNNRLCQPVKAYRFRYAFTERQIAHNGKRGKGTRSPHGLKDYPT